MAPILITGATGSTGRTTIKYLLQKGLSVRAFVHKEDDRSRQLEAQGAEVVVGNLLDLRSVRRAFEGVKRAYFCYPVQPGLIDATTIFAQAAKEAKAEYIVNMSQIVARGDVPSNASINHWLSERVFDWAGTPVTHLQPTIFHEWLVYAGQLIRNEDRFAVPFSPTGKFASVSTEDIGELTATLLENPAGHEGQSYPLAGPTELTPPEIADVLSKHLGREIRFEQIKASVLIRSFSPVEIPYLEQHFNAAGEMHRDGLMAGTNDLFEKIIGHPPQSTDEFVAENKSIWEKHAEEFTVHTLSAVVFHGTLVVSALVNAGFKVSTAVRQYSVATYPKSVTVHETNYSKDALVSILQGQDVVVSCIPRTKFEDQRTVADACVSAGVKRFLPSEYGGDTTLPDIEKRISFTAGKREFGEYLVGKESEGLTWTRVFTGPFFDWMLTQSA